MGHEQSGSVATRWSRVMAAFCLRFEARRFVGHCRCDRERAADARFRFGAGAHAGGSVDIQDFLLVPIGGGSFDESWRCGCVMRRQGRSCERGALMGVADEGGWWTARLESRASMRRRRGTRAVKKASTPQLRRRRASQLRGRPVELCFRGSARETSEELGDLLRVAASIHSAIEDRWQTMREGMRSFPHLAGQIMWWGRLSRTSGTIAAAAAEEACNAVLPSRTDWDVRNRSLDAGRRPAGEQS